MVSTPTPPPHPALRPRGAGLPGLSAAMLWAAALALAGPLTLWSAPTSAEPRFALRQGMACAHCHINRTGGGMRTRYGSTFSQTGLATWDLPGIVDPHAGESIDFGANLRLSNRTTLQASTELEGKQRKSNRRNSFDITEGNLYVRAAVVPERLHVYIDETVAPEAAANREAFVMLQGLPLDGYVKAGRFLLAYGLRLPDDTNFIRQETGFTYANQDLGLEVGFAPGPFNVALAITNGSLGGADPNLAKQVTGHVTWVGPALRGGVSVAWNDTSSPDFAFSSLTFGGHLGARLGRLVLLSEFDWIKGFNPDDTYDQWALYTGADLEVVKGVYLRGIFEAFDPLFSLANNERDRFVFGVSWLPLPMLEVRAEYRLNRDIPQRVEGNADEIVVELHGFL